MSANRLVVTIEATHQSLQQRLDEATRPRERSLPRDNYRRTDAFLSATSRHLAAVEEVMLGQVRHRLGDGHGLTKDYLHAARHLEHALARLKARLYGEQHTAHVPWVDVWDDVRQQLTRHNELERILTADLAEVLDEAECDALAERVYRAELHAPTRAHPNIPHTGLLGLVARRIWALADRFWDTAEGRSVPQPVRPHPKDHSHDSLMAQYVVGEALFNDRAPVFTHRHHGHGQGHGHGHGQGHRRADEEAVGGP